MGGLRATYALVVAVGLLIALPSDAAVTLAIVPTRSADRELVDQLTAELSRRPGIDLVERAQLPELTAESALLGRSALALLKPGTADGLVVVETFGEKNKRFARYRLVSVAEGVALGWWSDQISGDDSATWSEGAGRRIAGLARKLTVRSDRLKTVSFVGFRSPTRSHESLALEREINGLFLNRIGSAQDLLMLERRRLSDAAFEKSLNADDRAFWNAAALVEGTINPNGWAPGRVTLRWRLIRGAATNAFESTMEGSATNLLEIAERFTAEIRNELGLIGENRPWNHVDEAARFAQEAEAATRSGIWREAITAADTATALGLEAGHSLRLRIAAYAGSIRDAADFGNDDQFYCAPGGVLRAYCSAPDEDDVEAALETAHLLRDFARFEASEPAVQDERLSATALETLGRLLLKFYLNAELRSVAAGQIRDLRVQLRAFAADYIADTRRHWDTRPDPFGSAVDRSLNSEMSIPVVLAKYGALFHETPEEGLALQRWTYSFPSKVEPLFGPPPDESEGQISWWEWTPELCGWTCPARERADKVWKAFTAAMPVQIAARRQIIALNRAATDAAVEEVCHKTLDFFTREEDTLISGKFRTRFLADFEDRWGSEALVLAAPVRAGLETNLVPRLRETLGRIDFRTAEFPFALGRPAYQFPSARTMQRWQESLAKRRFPTTREIGDWTVGLARAPKEEQRQLLATLKAILRFPEAAERTNDVATMRRVVSGLEMRTRIGEKPPWLEVQGLDAPHFPASMESVRLFDVPDAPHIRPAGPNGILPSEYFRCEPPLRVATVTGLCWGEGRLWLMGEGEGQTVNGPTLFLSEFDPRTDKFIHHVVPENLVSGRPSVEPPRVAIGASKVLIALGRNVVVLDRRTDRFSVVAAPLEGAQVARIGNRVFFHDQETLIETTEDLERFFVLASARRQPAMNDLDRQSTWAGVQVMANGSTGVWAVVNHRVFDLGRSGGTEVPWSEIPKTVRNFPAGSFLTERPSSHFENDYSRIWWFGRKDGEPRLLWKGERWSEADATAGPKGTQSPILPFLDTEARPLLLGDRLLSGPLLIDGGKSAQIEVLISGVWHPLTFWTHLDAKPVFAVEPIIGDEDLFFYPSFDGRPKGDPGFFIIRAVELVRHADQLIAAVMSQSDRDRDELNTLIRRWDTDSDGHIGPSERFALATAPNLLNAVWWQIDTNQNNILDLDEIGYFDFDHNGTITGSECDAFWNAAGLLAQGYFAHLGGSATNAPSVQLATTLSHAVFGQMDCRRYDADQSGHLEWPEWLAMFAEAQHRKLTWGIYLPALGLSPDDVQDAPIATTFLDPDLLMYLHHLKLQPRKSQ
jgi:hypothetical protein